MERRAITQQWQVSVTSDQATLNFPITYWPGWQAVVNDQSIDTRAASDLGYIQIDLLRGEHQVKFKLGNTPIRTGGEIISLIAWIVVLIALVPLLRAAPWWRVKSLIKSPTTVAVLGVVMGYTVFIGILQNADTLVPAADDLTMDFVSQPWLHHNPGGHAFRDDVYLDNYELKVDANAVQANLWWNIAPTPEVSATLSLVTPSTHLFGGPSPIVQTVALIQSGVNTYTLRSPYALPTGMYYVTVQVDDDTQFLRPIRIENYSVPTTSQFGSLTPAIGLAAAQTQLRDPDRLDVLLQWAISSMTDANYGISLRLHDASGKVWTSLDMQPGYGFQPTSAWQPGTLNDAYTLDLPADLPRNQVYALDVILYRIVSQQEVGRTTIDGLRLEPHDWRSIEPPARNFTAPVMPHLLDAVFGDQIQLLGYDLKREGDVLKIDLAWKALRNIDRNYKVFAHVFDPATKAITAQWDAMPRDNAYPTSRWIENEVVTETLTIPLTNVPPGDYRIAVGLYELAGRLTVSGALGIDAGNRRVILAEEMRR
ncbi:MAG: YfhO family protein [Chloroflexi bacterium]|nr:YfhO family protein [Chloroflexota bacterium]